MLPDGTFYVSDGYCNTPVAKFSANGDFEFQWGTPGKNAGEFNMPDSIAVDSKRRVYVADHENVRVQVFDSGGVFLQQWRLAEKGLP